MSFTIFQNNKNAFLGKKKKQSSKSKKIDIFPKGLTHGFGPNIAIFPTSFFQTIQAKKMSFTIFQKKKKPFQPIKTSSPQSRKMDIFLTCSLQAIQARKISFTIFQNEKTPVQGIKTRSLISRKIDIFPKGLTHGFGPKMAIFPACFFQAIQARKMSFTIF